MEQVFTHNIVSQYNVLAKSTSDYVHNNIVTLTVMLCSGGFVITIDRSVLTVVGSV